MNNKKIMLFDPAISTINKGDEIISDSAGKYIRDLFPEGFFVKVSTHMAPSIHYMHTLRHFDTRFVCGSNLLKSNMLLGYRQWNISMLNAPFVKKAILVGCGWWQYQKSVDAYSRILYKTVLSKEYFHSVRDNYTVSMLNSIGIKNVVNTGCPTMWKFTTDYCATIPQNRSKNVITTLTDYKKDIEKDSQLLSLLSSNYSIVYLWIQGSYDMEYYREIKQSSWNNIKIIPPSLEHYDKVLETNSDIEYVGTRLHAGIRALQHGKRTMIIAVDNRAIEKKRDFNLPVITRDEQSSLLDIIDKERTTEIRIPEKEIEMFLSQFK